MGNLGPDRLSLVLEMDNAEMLTAGEIEETIVSLAEQLRLYRVERAEQARPQLIFGHPGIAEDSELLRMAAADVVPDLDRLAEQEFLGLPEGRYYELKNRGVAAASGDIVVILFDDEMRKQGIPPQMVDAHVQHKPPRGWRFFVWRALVTGRDADRRFKALKSGRRGWRVANSFSRLFTAEWQAARRLPQARHVGIALWQTPFAFALISLFNGLAFLGQATMAVGLKQDVVERVPDYVERS